MTPADTLKNADTKMAKAIEVLQSELTPIRTGRAHPGLLDSIRVDYYGTSTPLKQIAVINAPEVRMLSVQPFDPGARQSIEKAINEAGIGLTASQAGGNLIRVPVPELSEERRKEYVKLVGKLAEEARVAIRNVRRDANDEIKKLEKAGTIAEDEGKRLHDQIQKKTDKHVAEIDRIVQVKDKELMTV